MNPYFFLLIVPTFIIGFWAMNRIESTYRKFSKVGARSGITGFEAARYVLQSAGIHDVKIASTKGHLTDHYNPMTKTLVLSEQNYAGSSLAALGVAAHEAGHAIQHATGYGMLKARMALVPITNIASQALPFVIIGGFIFGSLGLLKLGILVYLVLTVFQLVTLPVEFDASKRATFQLAGLGIISEDERPGVVKTLNAAGWTYVAAFISSLANLIYLVLLTRD
ncbi:MAG: zinc metallopeptidase [Puniceicoccaceae bacterium]